MWQCSLRASKAHSIHSIQQSPRPDIYIHPETTKLKLFPALQLNVCMFLGSSLAFWHKNVAAQPICQRIQKDMQEEIEDDDLQMLVSQRSHRKHGRGWSG